MTAGRPARRLCWRLVATALIVCLGAARAASAAPTQRREAEATRSDAEAVRTFETLERTILARTRAGRGADDETRGLAERARQLAERTWPAHEPHMRRAVGLTALVAFSTGSYDESVRLYRRALAPARAGASATNGAGRDRSIRDGSRRDTVFDGARLGLDDEARARLLDGYGQALGQTGQHRGAVRILGEALDLRVRARGPDHPDVATVLEHLAAVQLDQGERTQARAQVERALAIREARASSTITTAAADPDPFLGVSLNLMGDVLWFEGQFAQAERWYARALCVSQRMLGPLHPLVALQTRNYANAIRRSSGDAARAGALLQWAVRIAEGALGRAHPEVAGTLNDLAVVARSQGDYLGARQYYERAMRAIDTRLGAGHLWAATVRHNLALLCQRLGDLPEAIRLERQAEAIWTRTLGATHANVGRAASALGGMYADAEFDERARRSYVRAIAIREARDGPAHENVAVTRAALADLLMRMGRFDAAWTENARALAIWEAAGATTDPWFLGAQATRGRLQAARGDLAAARATLASVVATQARVFGPDNPDLGRLRITFGELLATLAASDARAVGTVKDRASKDEASNAGASKNEVSNDEVSKEARSRDEALKDAALKDAALRDAALETAALTDEALAQAVEAESVGRAHLQLTMRDLSERVALGYAAARPKGLDLAASIVTRGDAASAAPARVRTVFDTLVRSRGVVLDEMAARHRGEMAAGTAPGVTTGGTAGGTTGVATGGATGALVGAAIGATDGQAARAAAADLAARAATLSRARQRLANLIVRGPESLSAERYQRLVDEARAEKEAAERALAAVSDEFRASQRRGQLTLDGVRAALPADAALVSFLRFDRLDAAAPRAARVPRTARSRPRSGELVPGAGGAGHGGESSGQDNSEGRTAGRITDGVDGGSGAAAAAPRAAREGGQPSSMSPRRARPAYVAFVLRAGSPDVVVVPLGEAAAIEADVRRWRAEIRTGLLRADRTLAASERAARTTGGALRRRVWDPLTPHLQNVSRLFIVPDGALHLVSFAALPLDAPASAFLVETGPTLHYLATERELVPPERPAPVGRGLLALGAPAFGAAPLGPTLLGPAPSGQAPFGQTPLGQVSSAAASRGVTTPVREEQMAVASTRGASEANVAGDAPCLTLQSMRFEALPGSLREIEEVARIWSGARRGDTVAITAAADAGAEPESADLLSRAAASELAFKRGAPGRRVLHLATHGFFLDAPCAPAPRAASPASLVAAAAGAPAASPVSSSAASTAASSGTRNVGATRAVGGLSTKPSAPGATRVTAIARIENPLMSSGLAFAGVNRRARLRADSEDGLLTAEEVAGLDLRGVEWAVLSACDTGVGAIASGEGVFGLRRAFQIAGVRTVILSLWAVEDRSAVDWMRVLYERRRAGADTAAAVRAASLELLRQRRARGASTHPFFWAGFVASGEWR